MKRVFYGLATVAALLVVPALGQDGGNGTKRTLTFGQRLGQFGRNLLGDPDGDTDPYGPNSQPQMRPHTHAPAKSPTLAPPKGNTSSAKSSGKTPAGVNPATESRLSSASKAAEDPNSQSTGVGTDRFEKSDSRSSSTASSRRRNPASTASKAIASEPALASSDETAGSEKVSESRTSEKATSSKATSSKIIAEKIASERSEQALAETAEERTPPPASTYRSAPVDDAPRMARSESFDGARSMRGPSQHESRPASQMQADAPASHDDGTGSDDRLVTSRSAAALQVETFGPRRITIGKEAQFTVRLRNSGDLPAHDVSVVISIPSWAEVVTTSATAGSATASAVESGYQWRMSEVPARSQQELALKIVPRKSQSFDLAVKWTYTPPATQATVEVEEPKLQMAITGPAEVIYGQQQLYKLTLSNPGNGDAENVILSLLPITPQDGSTASHRVGKLKAGSSTSVEIELTARHAGRLTIKAEAIADADLRTSAATEVSVRRAALEATVSAPRMHYAGTACTCEVRVRNSGDATARQVALAALLPSGAEFLSASHGGHSEARANEVLWTLDQLEPGAERVLSFKCKLQVPGSARIEAVATGEGDLKVASSASTQVMAVADLVLDVRDTPGPIPVGEDVVYTVKIHNRGTSAAEAVEIIGFFSNGIEPVGVEGGAHQIGPGTVHFKATELAVGGEHVYKIKARASSAGNHQLRVEVQCKTLGTRLTQELTSLFYGEENIARSSTGTETR